MMDVILRNPLFLVIFGISLALLIVRIFKGSSDTNDAKSCDCCDEWKLGAFGDEPYATMYDDYSNNEDGYELAQGAAGIEPYATMYGFNKYDD